MSETLKDKIVKEIVEWIKVIVITAILALIITSFVRPTLVIGESMTNTFQPYDYLVVSKRAYKNKLPEYGDVILFQSHLPLDDQKGEKILIKRVIGLPGDTIQILEGKVFRNGTEIIENYTRDGYTDGNTFVEVPEDELFVLGDNRGGSRDSRDASVGTVPLDVVLGKVIIRLFPFTKITTDFGA